MRTKREMVDRIVGERMKGYRAVQEMSYSDLAWLVRAAAEAAFDDGFEAGADATGTAIAAMARKERR